jgi:DNA-binding response OmpR family regulator
MPSKILHSITILLVEDHEGFRSILTNYLISLGAKVIECGNFFQAKEHVARQSADLVLTDLQLPDGDGFELMAEVRKHRFASERNVPVVAMSALGNTVGNQRLLAARFSSYLTKPFTPRQLIDTIQTALAGADGATP